jgi:Zn-dependent peptidase ImmA (M78 family)/transcriptional regulator with XRE-family HTH domain
MMDRDELARAAQTTAERIAEFEAGSPPTLRQLSLMATRLDRPPAFFFTVPPDMPDVPAAPDFRGRAAGGLPPALAKQLRRAERRRVTLLELEDSIPSPTLPGATTRENVNNRADEFRAALGLSQDSPAPAGDRNEALKVWVDLLERHGYLVFQTTRIAIETYRGVSISHDKLPIVLLNGSDSPAGKIFTLFHEVAHIANRTSGLCVLNNRVGAETVANAFSAAFLMPTSAVREQLARLQGSPISLADALADRFKVSPLATGIRLRTLALIDEEALNQIWREADKRAATSRESQRSAGGHPPPWRLRYRDLGRPYVGAVARALEDERIDWLDAAYLLDARVPMAEQIFDEYHRAAAGS